MLAKVYENTWSQDYRPSILETPGSWLGRGVKVTRESYHTWTNTCSFTEPFHSLVRFTLCLAQTISPLKQYDKLVAQFSQVDNLIDASRLFGDLPSTIRLENLKLIESKQYFAAASNVAFFVAAFGSFVHELGAFGVVNLAQISAKIGTGPVRTFVAKVVTGIVATQVQTLAYGLWGIQVAIRIADGKTCGRNILILATCIAEVIHKVFVYGVLLPAMAAATAVPASLVVTAGVLGMGANGLGIALAYEEIFGRPCSPK